MRIAVVGGGSLGLLLAGKLAASGYAPVLVTRTEEQAEAIQKNGLTITGLSDMHIQVETKSFSRTGETENWEWLLLTVKQGHIGRELLRYLHGAVSSGTRIILFQNGIGHVEKLAALFPPERLYAAVTTVGALRETPSRIRHTGDGEIWLGRAVQEAAESVFDEEEKKLEGLLTQAGISTSLSNNMVSKVWEKLLTNAVINPLTAVLRIRNGELLECPERIHLMRLLFEEGVQLAESLRIPLRDDLWEHIQNVCRLTADNQSSMLQDVLAGRGTEIDWINGGLLRVSEARGKMLTAHRMAILLVKSGGPA